MGRGASLTFLGINSVFMVTALLLITLGYYLQTKSIYFGLLITELVIILLPVILYVRWKGADPREIFRIRKIGIRTLGLCILITLCIYPVGLFINLIGNIILSMFGELIPVSIPVAESISQYLINILVIGMAAGVAEELFFRGFILKGYEALGQSKSVIISALLFGMFHFNIQNFIGPVFLGLIFGHMAIKTGSIIAPIAGHFTNNALSVTFMYIAGKSAGTPIQASQNAADTQTLMMALVVWGIFAAAGGIGARRLFNSLKKPAGFQEIIGLQQRPQVVVGTPRVKDFVPIIITIIIFAAFCVGQFFMITGNASL